MGEKTGAFRSWSYALLGRGRGELMGLALLWVLLFHTYHLAPIPIPGAEWLKAEGYFGVDVFLFLSALGLSVSLSRRAFHWRDYLFRRAVRILPAYWLVVGIYGLVLRLAGRVSLRTVLWDLSTLYYWFRIPNTFNWYIPALLALYLLTPLLFRAMDRCPRREWIPALIWILALPVSTLLGLGGVGHVNDFVCRLPVFSLGLLVGWYMAHDRPLTGRALVLWGLLAVCSPLPGRLWPRIGIYFPPVLTFTLVCLPLCLAVARLITLPKENSPVRRLLRLLGESSLEIYLLNVIAVLEYDFFSQVLPVGRGHLLYYGVTTLLEIAMGLALHRLLEPLVRALRGRLAPR